MTTSARVALFEVAANPDPDSTLPFLIRLPLSGGELVLKARDSWPRTAKVYCHRAEDGWPDDPKIVERIPVRSCQRRGVAIDLTVVPKGSQQPPVDPAAHYGSCAGPDAARAPDNSLDMATSFDCFSVKSWTRATGLTRDQQARRALLVRAMARHGFVNYKREWWHFSYPAADPGREFDFSIR